MAETLAAVKRHYGKHAVILSTRTRSRGAMFGIGVRPYVEITAARDLADLPAPLRRGTLTAQSKHAHRADGAARPVTLTHDSIDAPRADALLTEVGTLKSMVSSLMRETRRGQGPHLPDELYDAYSVLIENAVAEEIADELVASVRGTLTEQALRDPNAVRAALADSLRDMVPTAGAIDTRRTDGPTVIALVGPTGVGKTTTVAKLAANFSLRENRKVGLVTIDTYRIAAVEQLRTYAEIINVPLEVASSPGQMSDVVASMHDRDVILVDTAGRSQRDAVRINDLRRFFDATRPHETHLVLSSTCSERVLLETIDRFAPLGVDRMIFTKLDEAVGFGVVLKCLQRAKVRLSYVTTGQDVPDDIEVGRCERFVDLIVGQRERRSPLAVAS